MMVVEGIHSSSLFLLLIIAAFCDVKFGKIFNWTIISGIVIASSLAVLQGMDALISAIAGGTAALIMGFLFWKLHIFRAGDAKLLWMAMQFVGIDRLPQHMAAIFIAGGICALGIMLQSGVLLQRIKRVGSYFMCMLLSRKFSTYVPIPEDPCRFPFAVAVLVGEVAAYIYFLH